MNEPTISISLELQLIDDCLAGCLIDAAGERREFLGRLGLLAALDALVEQPHPTMLAHGDD